MSYVRGHFDISVLFVLGLIYYQAEFDLMKHRGVHVFVLSCILSRTCVTFRITLDYRQYVFPLCLQTEILFTIFIQTLTLRYPNNCIFILATFFSDNTNVRGKVIKRISLLIGCRGYDSGPLWF